MYEMEIQLNLDKICRLCLEEKCEQLQDVFDSDSNLCENIFRATTVKIQEGDDLPAHVCHQCISLVNVIVNFQHKCVVADLALHHYVRKCICQKEHKECEAVKLYPKDPLQLTQVIKTEGGSCQIKSETRVFTLQEGRDEVITGIIEENTVNPRVNIKAEQSESSLRTTKSLKVRCNSTVVKVRKRRRRKGHRWKIKKQSSANRQAALRIHLQTAAAREYVQSIGSLQNTNTESQKLSQNTNNLPTNKKQIMEKSAENRILSPATSSVTATGEAHPSTVSAVTQPTTRSCLPKTTISRSSSVVLNKTLMLEETVQKRRASSSDSTITFNKSSIGNMQNKRVSQNSDSVIANKKAVEVSPQKKKVSHSSKVISANKKSVKMSPQNPSRSQNSDIILANKKTESNEYQQSMSSSSSDISKTFLANNASASKESTLNQRMPQSSSSAVAKVDKSMKIQTRKSIIKLTKENTTQKSYSANQQPEIEEHPQIQLAAPTRNSLKNKPASEKNLTNQQVQQSCNQQPEIEEHVRAQTRLPSNKKPATEESISNQNLPQRGKSVPVNKKLVTEENLQSRKVSPARSLKNKPVTEQSTLNGSLPQSIKKLVIREHLQIQKVSPLRKSLKNTPSTEESASHLAPSCNSLTNHKEDVQIRKVSPTRNSLRNKSAALEPTSNQNVSGLSNQKLKEHVQVQRVPPKRKSVTNVNSFPADTSDTVLSSKETFQPEEQQSCDKFPANEKPLQNTSDNTFPNKRKNSETESSVPETSKKPKTQINDRLTKLVIQVQGSKLCCSQCDSQFEGIENLKRHLEELHKKRVVRWHTVVAPGPEQDSTPSLLCTSCGKQFTSQRLFASHHNNKSCC